ncbi:MAG: phosphosulfolactate synthase [Alicyclobacillus herbarius]|uniref:phosphosulfolactate synthase n=1 Tax=Alicyclobacillus herbarius TaxID=122960 RepID=UPI00235278A6|nr:phosphosulfolactate synthase [Alicyclobacillus herbarius]MCL6631670.1 phosphosulfolactate synthase [Alicyclobacillus herbarius]
MLNAQQLDVQHLAFANLLAYPVPEPVSVPDAGRTMVIDKGMGPSELDDWLTMVDAHVHWVKLGFGSARLYRESVLREKIAICRRHGVELYLGGTLTEIAIQQGRFDAYLAYIRKLGIGTVEISEGTFPLTPALRRHLIERAALTHQVLTEVGNKFAPIGSAEETARQVASDLAAGARYVILEGRESGRGAGLYDRQGELDEAWFHSFVCTLDPASLRAVIWEAPLKSQQLWLLNHFGSVVNLGNIPPEEALAVAALRHGLRADRLIQVLEQAIPGR